MDASFAAHADGKGHSALVVTVGRATVLCKSSKQKIVTKDSTESELVALSDMIMEIQKCWDFMTAQGHKLEVPVVWQDNMSTITLVTNGGGKYRNKYMQVRQQFVKEKIDCGESNVKYLPTKQMLADILTKALQGDLFRVMACGVTGMPLAGHRGA